MNVGTPALLLAAAGVGFGHAVMPDHWAPLAVVGRARRYSAMRVARVSAAAGVAHVIVSLILGAVIVLIGLQFRSSIAHIENAVVGGILIVTAIGFAVVEALGRGHHHGPGGHTHGPDGHAHGPDGRSHGHGGHSHGPDTHTHEPLDHSHGPEHSHSHPHGHSHEEPEHHGALAAMIPFGAAASPDLTILPVFLAAAATGAVTAVSSLVVFAAVTIGTMVTLTLIAFSTGRLVGGDWIERWGNWLTATVLLVIGLLVITGTI